MGTITENCCFRQRQDCVPASNISSDENASSFICVGFNKVADRSVPQDRFTVCWKNDAIDTRDHWDKRDILDTMSVLAQALSIDENIRVNSDMTETEMQQADFQP